MMTPLDQRNANAPTHSAYFVKSRKGKPHTPDWIKVGAAWDYPDGEGLNLILTNLGQSILLIVRPNKPKAE